jgi:hypothetical protein
MKQLDLFANELTPAAAPGDALVAYDDRWIVHRATRGKVVLASRSRPNVFLVLFNDRYRSLLERSA